MPVSESTTGTDTRFKLATLGQWRFTAARLVEAGMSDVEAAAKGKRFAQAARQLMANGRSDDEPAIACFVPGRIEVLGKHTDYCGGRSLLCTVERGMCFVAVANADKTVNFHALNRNESASMEVSLDIEPTVGLWSNYPMTVCRRIARNFPGSTGADIAMSSDLPPASGLSSSSAMVIGTFLVLSALNDLPSRDEYRRNIAGLHDLAAYLGCCENGQTFRRLQGDRGVGTFGGSQDHTAILCCKPGKISCFSFCPVVHEADFALPEDFRFFVAASGVSAEKTGFAMAKYNSVAERAGWLLKLWNENSAHRANCLREAILSTPASLETMRRILKEHAAIDHEMRLSERLDQFVTESEQLIPDAMRALRQRDWTSFGDIVDRSQRLAETGLSNQIAATVTLQRSLRATGALAASSFGAGFGGSVWALGHEAMEVSEEAAVFGTRPSCAAITMG